MGVFPLQLDVPMQRWPWMNWVVLGLLVAGFLGQLAAPDVADRFIMGVAGYAGYEHVDEHPLSWIGHMFIHADLFHLLGNLWLLWVFGNAICAKVGNGWYLPMWLGFGLLSAVAQPEGLGASGAIYGIVGFTLVFYPINEVTLAYWFIIRFGTFTLASCWVILTYVAFDLLGMAGGGEEVAYLAHVAGCASGAGLALILIGTRVLEPTEQEWTILEILGRHSKTLGLSTRKPAGAGTGSGAPDDRMLHVRLSDGRVKHLPIHEFLRHEAQGKSVNQFPVSEDGESWTTFGEWRKARS